jgi:hypothetical protein
VCISDDDRACQGMSLKPAGHNFRDTCVVRLNRLKVVRLLERQH